MHMGALGALLTIAPKSLYVVYHGTTWPWGLSPLEDQQLGGLLIWIPGGFPLLIFSLSTLGLYLRGLDGAPLCTTLLDELGLDTPKLRPLPKHGWSTSPLPQVSS
jgi:putative membrane protein